MGRRSPSNPDRRAKRSGAACGKSVTAPTLLELTRLERAEAVETPGVDDAAPNMGHIPASVAVGCRYPAGVGRLLMAVWVVPSRPEPLFTSSTPELIHREVERWPAFMVLGKFWQIQKEGIDRGAQSTREKYDQALATLPFTAGCGGDSWPVGRWHAGWGRCVPPAQSPPRSSVTIYCHPPCTKFDKLIYSITYPTVSRPPSPRPVEEAS